MFWLVGTKIGFFELYIAKSSVFAFCLLKHVALTQRSVCRKVVLFPSLKGFLPVCSESPCFSLDCTQNHVFSCDWLSDNGFASVWLGYVVFSIIFVRTASIAFSLFNCQSTLFSALLHQKHVLALVTVKLGFLQRNCTGKWISFPVFLRLTLIFTLGYSEQRFDLF